MTDRPKIIFGRGLKNLQLKEMVEAEVQMQYTGQIQQKIVLKSYNWWIFVIFYSFYVKKKEISATM
jgi:hypothetical protein